MTDTLYTLHSRASGILFRLLLILAVLTACASFTWTFGWDQGIFAWIGDVIIRGGLPYRDSWDIKGPLPYYVYAGAEWLLGRHGWSIRVVDIVFMLAASLVLFRMLHAWCNRSMVVSIDACIAIMCFMCGLAAQQPEGDQKAVQGV